MHCIDTPSFNGQLHDPVRVKELGELLTKVAAGVDAFLFVVKCTRYRYAEGICARTQEKLVLRANKQEAGDNGVSYFVRFR